MISKTSHPAEWALLLMDIEEVQEHVAALIEKMDDAGAIDEAEFAVDLGRIYAHLNRVWHGRDGKAPVGPAARAAASRFPEDIEPVG